MPPPGAATMPTVSVLMTAYNRADYIAGAMGSVLASDFEDLELIVVDDGSSDDTFAVAQAIAEQDARVRVYRNAENLGDYPNRRHAATLARGKYLKYVDSDDMIYPWGLGAFVRCMEQHPEAGFGLSARSEFDQPHPVAFAPHATYREEFFGREFFGRAPGSSIIVRKAYEAVGGFSARRHVGDMELWFRLGAHFPMVSLPPALVWDRIHDGQEKGMNSNTDRAAMRARITVEALAAPDCPLNEQERSAALEAYRKKLWRQFWRILLRHRRLAEAIRFHQTVLNPTKRAHTVTAN